MISYHFRASSSPKTSFFFDIFGEISVETVSLKFDVFNEKLGVVGGISLFLGILVTNSLSENDF